MTTKISTIATMGAMAALAFFSPDVARPSCSGKSVCKKLVSLTGTDTRHGKIDKARALLRKARSLPVEKQLKNARKVAAKIAGIHKRLSKTIESSCGEAVLRETVERSRIAATAIAEAQQMIGAASALPGAVPVEVFDSADELLADATATIISFLPCREIPFGNTKDFPRRGRDTHSIRVGVDVMFSGIRVRARDAEKIRIDEVHVEGFAEDGTPLRFDRERNTTVRLRASKDFRFLEATRITKIRIRASTEEAIFDDVDGRLKVSGLPSLGE